MNDLFEIKAQLAEMRLRAEKAEAKIASLSIKIKKLDAERTLYETLKRALLDGPTDICEGYVQYKDVGEFPTSEQFDAAVRALADAARKETGL